MKNVSGLQWHDRDGDVLSAIQQSIHRNFQREWYFIIAGMEDFA
jgi:hypothetical protein